MPLLLSRLPTTDPNTGDLLAVIETPKDSPNKYDYDETCAAFRLAEVMPKGSYFPYDFGFIPSTVGDDGDPLDVLVFMDDSAPVGCVLTIRLIGGPSKPSKAPEQMRAAEGSENHRSWDGRLPEETPERP
jgi:inorganic pyrophosphatase